MRQSIRNARPSLETLEGRSLPSITPFAPAEASEVRVVDEEPALEILGPGPDAPAEGKVAWDEAGEPKGEEIYYVTCVRGLDPEWSEEAPPEEAVDPVLYTFGGVADGGEADPEWVKHTLAEDFQPEEVIDHAVCTFGGLPEGEFTPDVLVYGEVDPEWVKRTLTDDVSAEDGEWETPQVNEVDFSVDADPTLAYTCFIVTPADEPVAVAEVETPASDPVDNSLAVALGGTKRAVLTPDAPEAAEAEAAPVVRLDGRPTPVAEDEVETPESEGAAEFRDSLPVEVEASI